jgi:hypothetical protein
MTSATPVTPLKSMDLTKLRDVLPVFNANKKRSLQFNQQAKHIKDLLRVYTIVTSKTEITEKWLRFTQEDNGKYCKTKRLSGRQRPPTTASQTSSFPACPQLRYTHAQRQRT